MRKQVAGLALVSLAGTFAVHSAGAAAPVLTFPANAWTTLASAGVTGLDTVSLSPAFQSDGRIYLGDSGHGVLLYDDTGPGLSLLSNLDGSGVTQVRAATPSVIFAVTHAGRLYRSIDAGANWSADPVSNPVAAINGPVLAVAPSPFYAVDRTVFAGMGQAQGVMRSTDGGATFQPASTGIIPGFDGGATATVTALAVSPHFNEDQVVFAGTLDRGVFATTDAGTAWSQALGTPLANAPSQAALPMPKVLSIALSPAYSLSGRFGRDLVVVSLALTPGTAMPGGIYTSYGSAVGGVNAGTFHPITTATNLNRPATSIAFSPMREGDGALYTAQPPWNGAPALVLRNDRDAQYGGDAPRDWCPLPVAAGPACSTSANISDPRELSVSTVGDNSISSGNTGYHNLVFVADANTGLSVLNDTSPTVTSISPTTNVNASRPVIDMYGYNLQAGSTVTFELIPLGPLCTAVVAPIAVTWISPSHVQVLAPDSTGFASCGAVMLTTAPDGMFNIGPDFLFRGPIPRALYLTRGASRIQGGDTVVLDGFDFSSTTVVQFTRSADPNAAGMPCDGVRVYCTFPPGIHFPTSQTNHMEVTTPRVQVGGFYDVTIVTGAFGSNTLRLAMLYAQFRFVDSRGDGYVYMEPEPQPRYPNLGFYSVQLNAGSDPLNPTSAFSTRLPGVAFNMQRPVAGTMTEYGDTNSNDHTILNGVFRTDTLSFVATMSLPDFPTEPPGSLPTDPVVHMITPTGRTIVLGSCGAINEPPACRVN
ncbi:MAG: WD40/YVTN/BNR-like repeat-containing protein [Candidatus Dormibacteria bacterium]